MKFNGKDITELLALNRRNFITLIVGGAVGIGLSPLPWKMADDSAIWTQNWPWVPVPPVGEFLHEKTVCTLCPGGCGIEVRKVDDRAVKIEGRTDYPVNPGGICPLGMGGLQLLYNEQIRFTGPVKRVGPRGSGKYVNIGWDEALSMLAGRISGLRKVGKVDSITVIDGNRMRSTMAVMIERLTKAIGSPNYMRIPTSEDTFQTAGMLMQGSDSPMAYDLENSDYILSFGSGLLDGWGAPGRIINAWGQWRKDRLKRATRIIQVESRASNTASKADQWVPARPGTEAALALGIAHVIIKKGLHNTEFVNTSASGFSAFKEMVLDHYSPEKVAEITGTDSNKIISLAEGFAKAKAPVAVCGKGKGALNGSLYESMAILALNALVGNINMPGGVLVHDPLPLDKLADIEPDAIAADGLQRSRLDQAGSAKYPFSRSLFSNFAEAIIKAPKSPVDTLLIFSANPAFTLPDGGEIKRAMEKVPFIVSFSPYHDESAYMADLVLPDHNFLEKTDDIVWPAGLQYPLYGMTRPVVEPLYDTRNSGDVIIQMAKQIGGAVGDAFPWEEYEEVLKQRARGLFDSSAGLTGYDGATPAWKQMKKGNGISPDYDSFDKMWEEIKSGGLWYRPAHTYKNWGSLFKTPSGKFEFLSTKIELAAKEASLEEMGISATGDEAFMPHYEHKGHGKGEGSHSLRMVPYEMINLASGWAPNPPYLKKTLFDHQLLKDESFAEINPETASKLRLKQGDRVVLKSHKGEVKVRINIFEGAMPGYVYLPLGLGHTAYDDFLNGKGVNPNHLVDGGMDPLSGQPVWWDTPVKLIRA